MSDRNLAHLIDNAFDFLETAIAEFKIKPKYSVIHFCASMELLLKARLLHEHWSLIVAVPQHQHPNKTKFEMGDFKSINFSDLIPKIENVTGDTLPNELKKSLSTLAQHRNKTIHFFHEAHTTSTDESIVNIAIEQCLVWFYMETQLKLWSAIFDTYRTRISKINRRIKGHKVFFRAIYKDRETAIKEAKARGARFVQCVRCETNGAQQKRLTDSLFKNDCMVCGLKEISLKLHCKRKKCKGALFVSHHSGDDATCPQCQYQLDNNYLASFLENEIAESVAPGEPDTNSIRCGKCSGEDIINHSDYYICSDCLYIAEGVESCGFCDERFIGVDLTESFLYGCVFCDGSVGWHKDD